MGDKGERGSGGKGGGKGSCGGCSPGENGGGFAAEAMIGIFHTLVNGGRVKESLTFFKSYQILITPFLGLVGLYTKSYLYTTTS